MARTFLQLSLEERALIQVQLSMGWRPAAIAAGLQRARSTITREMARNGWQPPDSGRRRGRLPIAGGYYARSAHRRAQLLHAKARVLRKLARFAPLWPLVLEHLGRGLSPEQIAFTLARMAEPVRLSHETIYTALYAMPRGHLRARVLTLLRRSHKQRRARTARAARPFVEPITLIDQRPSEVDERLIPGHWEGDLIKGKLNQSRVGILVERKTLFVALVQLSDGSAKTTAEGFARILNRFDAQMRLSMTYDQGREMAQHGTITKETDVKVYFAHPHSPWERGICENTNGLLRQYLPKGKDLNHFSQEDLDQIAWTLNVRPRKTLAWKAPAELFLPEGAFDFQKHWSTRIEHVALGA
jgi:IS30 family transposase